MPDALEDIEIRSEEVQEILTAVPSWMIRWGNSVILVIMLGLIAITYFVSYPDILVSTAIVTTEIPPQKIYANVSGKLDTLLVRDTDNILAGSPIAIIQNPANFTDVFYLKSIVDTIKLSKDGFVFPFTEMPILFLGDIEGAFAVFENNYEQYSLNKQLRPFDNEAIANQSSLSELQFRLQTLRNQKILNKSELRLREKEFNRDKQLFDKGVISVQDYETSQATYLRAKSNFASNDASISQVLESISNARKTVKGTNISSIKEEKVLLKSVIQSFNQLKKAILDWEMQYVLSTDLDGQLTLLNYRISNQSIQGNDLFAIIIPSENSAFVAKLKMPAQNSGKVKLGQRVQLSLENYPEQEYGVLEGKISRISAVTDDEGLYLIDVSLPRELVTTYKKSIKFRQEMPASARIITEDLRLIERFFYQFKNLFNN